MKTRGWRKGKIVVFAIAGLACTDPAGLPAEDPQTTLATLNTHIVDTGQDLCFDTLGQMACPGPGSSLFGQDAQHDGAPLSYTDNGDGTVTDNSTGLMWTQTPDLNGDGIIDIAVETPAEGGRSRLRT